MPGRRVGAAAAADDAPAPSGRVTRSTRAAPARAGGQAAQLVPARRARRKAPVPPQAPASADASPAPSNPSASDDGGASDGEGEACTGLPDAFDGPTRAAVDALLAAVPGPQSLERPSKAVAAVVRRALEALYAHALAAVAAADGGGAPPGALPSLHAGDGFDVEQVWLQLDAACGPLLRRAGRLLARAGGVDDGLLLPDAAEALDALLGEGAPSSSSEDEDEGGEDGGEGGSSGDDADSAASDDSLDTADLRSDDASDDDGHGGGVQRRRAPAAAAKPGEDRFLRYDEMEAFLQDAEREAAKEEGDEEADEDEEDADEEEEDEGDDAEDVDGELAAMLGPKGGGAQRTKPAAKAMYADLFGDDAGVEDDEEVQAKQYGEGDDGDEGDAGRSSSGAGASGDDGPSSGDNESEGGEADGGAPGPTPDDASKPLTPHERRLARMRERVAALEADAVAAKPWHLVGEVGAKARPLNSALEVDLEFERAVPPPPAPTAEGTADLEAMILARVREGRFDDPPRPPPPPAPPSRPALELDDRKSTKGLGELYEEEYAAAAGGEAADDGDGALRAEARALARALFARLDALAHFHYRPLPPGEEEEAAPAAVPALAVEEAAPVGTSAADRRAPEEVFAPSSKRLEVGELEATREERARARRARKRAGKAKKVAAAAGAPSAGALPAGRKSEAAAAAARAAAKQKKKGGAGAPPAAPGINYSKSGAVFAALQAERGAAPRKRPAAGAADAAGLSSKALKL